MRRRGCPSLTSRYGFRVRLHRSEGYVIGVVSVVLVRFTNPYTLSRHAVGAGSGAKGGGIVRMSLGTRVCTWTERAECRARRQLAGWQRVVLTVVTGPAHGALALARRLPGTAPVSADALSWKTLCEPSPEPLALCCGWAHRTDSLTQGTKGRLLGNVGVGAVCIVRARLQAHYGCPLVYKSGPQIRAVWLDLSPL